MDELIALEQRIKQNRANKRQNAQDHGKIGHRPSVAKDRDIELGIE